MRAQPAQRRAARLGGHARPAVRGPTGNFRPFLLFREPPAGGPGPAWRALHMALPVGDSESPSPRESLLEVRTTTGYPREWQPDGACRCQRGRRGGGRFSGHHDRSPEVHS